MSERSRSGDELKMRTRDEFVLDQLALFVGDGVPLVEARRIADDLARTVYGDLIDKCHTDLDKCTQAPVLGENK